MTLGEATSFRILELCNERNLSINKLAMISGMTQSTLNTIMNGPSKNPRLSTIKKICDGLEISLATFFDTPTFDSLEQEIY